MALSADRASTADEKDCEFASDGKADSVDNLGRSDAIVRLVQRNATKFSISYRLTIDHDMQQELSPCIP